MNWVVRPDDRLHGDRPDVPCVELPARLAPAAATTAATEVASAEAAARPATATAWHLRPSFVDGQTPSAELAVMELLDRRASGLVRAHLDEGEAAGATRGLIAHHAH
jgi:hypothetical protein